jgi:hypothetical protein
MAEVEQNVGFDFQRPPTDMAELIVSRARANSGDAELFQGLREVFKLDADFKPLAPPPESAEVDIPAPQFEGEGQPPQTSAVRNAIEFVKQVTIGAAGDAVIGTLGAIEELGQLLDSHVANAPPGLRQIGEFLSPTLGGRLAQDGPSGTATLNSYLERIVDTPSGAVTAGSRAVASFILAFASLSRGLRALGALTPEPQVAAGVVGAAQRTVANLPRLLAESGVTGLIVDVDNPRMDEMLAQLTPAAEPLRSAIQDFVDGSIDEPEYRRRLRERVVNAAEDLPLGLTIDTLFNIGRMWWRSRNAKQVLVAADAPVVPGEQVADILQPIPGAPQGRVLRETGKEAAERTQLKRTGEAAVEEALAEEAALFPPPVPRGPEPIPGAPQPGIPGSRRAKREAAGAAAFETPPPSPRAAADFSPPAPERIQKFREEPQAAVKEVLDQAEQVPVATVNTLTNELRAVAREGDIRRKGGQPFATPAAARRAGKGAKGEVVSVEDGFIFRPSESPTVDVPPLPRGETAVPPEVSPTGTVGRVEPEPVDLPTPPFVQERMEQARARAEAFGIAEDIRQLSQSGRTARQVVDTLADRFPKDADMLERLEIVRSTRALPPSPSPTSTVGGEAAIPSPSTPVGAPPVRHIPESRLARAQAALDELNERTAVARQAGDETVEITTGQFNDILEGLEAASSAGRPVAREMNEVLGKIRAAIVDQLDETIGSEAAEQLGRIISRRAAFGAAGGALAAADIAEAGEGDTDRRIGDAIMAVMAGAGLAALAPSLLRRIRNVRGGATKPASQVFTPARVVVAAAGRRVAKLVGPAETVDVTNTLTGLVVTRPATGGRLAVNFGAVHSADGLKKLVDDTVKLFPEAEAARVARLGTSQAELNDLVARTGAPITDILRAAEQKLPFSRQATALVHLQNASVERIVSLAKLSRDGTQAERLAAKEALAVQMGISAELAKAFNLGRSDFGRALNVFKQAADGALLVKLTTGKHRSGVTMDELVDMVLDLDPSQLPTFARKGAEPSLGGAIRELYLNTLLASTVTAVKAAAGNVASMTTLLPRRFLSGVANQLFVHAENGPVAGEALAGLQAMAGGAFDALRLAARTLRTGEVRYVEVGGSKIEGLLHHPQFTAKAFGIDRSALNTRTPAGMVMNTIGALFDWTGSLARTVGGRPLLAGDEAAQFLLERAEYRMLAYRNTAHITDAVERQRRFTQLLKDPDEGMIAAAKRTKQYFTFTNNLWDADNNFQWLRSAGASLQGYVERHPTMRFLFPFVRAGTNIPAMALELTPFVNLLDPTMIRKLTGQMGKEHQAEALGLMAFSTALGMAGVAAGAAGLIRGPVPVDPQLREEYERAVGPGNVLVVGDQQIPMLPDEPLGFVLTTMARIGQYMAGDISPHEEQAVTGFLLGMTQLIRNQSFLGAFARAVDAIHTGKLDVSLDTVRDQLRERTGETPSEARVLAEKAALTVDDIFLRSVIPPRPFQQLTQILDPIRRETDTLMERWQARTPGYSTDVPVARNRWGEPELRGFGQSNSVETGAIRDTVRVFTPFGPTEMKSGTPEGDASRVLLQNGIELGPPSYTRSIAGQSIRLNAAERSELLVLINRPNPRQPSFAESLNKLFGSKVWTRFPQTGPDSPRALMVQQLAEKYNEAGWQRLLQHATHGQNIRDRARRTARQTGFLSR